MREGKGKFRWGIWLGLTAAAFGCIVLAGVGILLWGVLQSQRLALSEEPAYTATELYAKAVEQAGAGEYALAEKYLESALTKQDDPSYRSQLAVVKYRLKKYDQAIAQYKKLVEAKKDLGFAWNGIGNAYRDWAEQAELEQLTGSEAYLRDAELAYKEAIAADARYVAAYSNLAYLWFDQGKQSEARGLLAQGITATDSGELRAIAEQWNKEGQ
jgi:tetratricopeptide (TPR) repeat protein